MWRFFYHFTFFPGKFVESKLKFEILSTGKHKLLESVSSGKGRLLRPPLGHSSRGLYFRLKIRQEYTTVGLYEAGDDDASEPIISYKVRKDFRIYSNSLKTSYLIMLC